MSPEAQRIAIAEACGKSVVAFRFWRMGRGDTEWKESPHYPTERQAKEARHSESSWGDVKPVEAAISHENTPDYPNDLNAMHEAERVLSSRQRAVFEIEVLHIMTGKESFDYERGDIIAVITATAGQHCEAFLRTLGKWDDSK